MPSVTYRPADEAAEIAARLIPEWHPHLVDARIVYVFRSEAEIREGKLKLGSCRKVGGLNAWLAQSNDPPQPDGNDFFVIELAEPEWHERLSDRQREALVDHELSHAYCEWGENEELKLSLVHHDIEEFAVIIDRHGLWHDDLTVFASSIAGALNVRIDDSDIPRPE